MIFNLNKFSEISQYPQPYYFFYYPFPLSSQIPHEYVKNQTQSKCNKSFYFERLLAKQLQIKHNESYIKMWTEEEDQKLLTLGLNCKNWRQLSREFHGKSAKVCHRRFRKLLNKQKHWPREKELQIKYLREVQGKSWVEIQMILKAQLGNQPSYKAKKIRERYKNYLEMDVSRQKWSLSQDIQLWKRVQELGKSWKEISVFFPSRSSLQIRNRYYKFLEPIIKKIQNSTDLAQQINHDDLQMI